jgi:colanic acid/amylovoran biosynthesis glycosyltransferase
VVSFCSQFLSPTRTHVYRQVRGIRGFENWVVTRHRVHAHETPYERLHVLRKSPLRVFSRLRAYAQRRRLAPLDRSEVQQLFEFLGEKRAVLVHAYFANEAVRLLPYFERDTRAKVVSVHGRDITEGAFPAADLERLGAAVDLILCSSRSLVAALAGRGCPPARLRFSPLGVPVPEGDWHREAPPVPGARPLRLLQVCRFVEKKGLDLSVRCLAILVDRGIDATLTLAGDGPERDPLRALARELGVSESVRFTGFLDVGDVARELRQHDVFLHPSRTTAAGDLEAIPSAILEAMAYGLPVISTDHSGIPEAITHEREGLLVSGPRAERLADAVERLVKDGGLYGRLSRGAAARVRAEFSVDACVAVLETHYREAIGMSQARRRAAPAR